MSHSKSCLECVHHYRHIDYSVGLDEIDCLATHPQDASEDQLDQWESMGINQLTQAWAKQCNQFSQIVVLKQPPRSDENIYEKYQDLYIF